MITTIIGGLGSELGNLITEGIKKIAPTGYRYGNRNGKYKTSLKNSFHDGLKGVFYCIKFEIDTICKINEYRQKYDIL